ncbi:hypothetical protein WJX72_000197 [[Myrmecia] bisecta]|uniref:Cyclic nucleotide-binding protein n=1 Tax=[Myrmecia] bisecta TaxID=41462 RepID=A0AAW1P0D6_9CHLO
MQSAEVQWLQQLPAFSNLPAVALRSLVNAASPDAAAEGSCIVSKGSKAEALLILRAGTAETLDAAGGIIILPAGSLFGLEGLLMNKPCRRTVTAASNATVWRISYADFTHLTAKYPDLSLSLYKLLSQELDAVSDTLEGEELRRTVLQPYLVSSPRRGIIGNSKYAVRLRTQVVAASHDADRKPVMIFGEPGLQKDNVAALIHFGSADYRKPMIRVDCQRLSSSGAELFGRGSKKGLLHSLQDGTLLLNNVQLAPPAVIAQLPTLLATGEYRTAPSTKPSAGSAGSGTQHSADSLGRAAGDAKSDQADREGRALLSKARILMVAERQLPALEGVAANIINIKVPPLRVRPSDVPPLLQFFLREASRRVGGGKRLSLTPAALRHLESYSYPDNIQELSEMVQRAVVQNANVQTQLAENVFWFATQPKDRFRIDLFANFKQLKQFARSALWPETINFRFTLYVYPLLVALLLFGPQDREHNFGLNGFWAYWWPLSFIVYPFLGRIWCSVCPFMIYGEVVQRWRLSQGAKLLKWPNTLSEKWGPWFLFGLFAAILVWEEVGDLPHSAALSGCLLLLITAGAMICSWFFERRYWCRFLCPIGGMNGLFAKLSMTELRASQGVCSSNCTTYHCYKGGPAEPPEGLETNGCPIHSHPAQLTDNRNCVLCMECVKACPHNSVKLRLRLPGVDLWTSHKPMAAELALMFMLLGAVYLHWLPQLAVYLHWLPQLAGQFGVDEASVQGQLPHIAASALVMFVPGALAWGAHVAAPPLASLAGAPDSRPAKPFLELGYGYLPLVWGATLSHYLFPLLSEAGRILPVAAATVGLEQQGLKLPILVAHPAVIDFLQGSCLVTGAALSLLLTRKIAARPWVTIIPQSLLVVALTAELWRLII